MNIRLFRVHSFWGHENLRQNPRQQYWYTSKQYTNTLIDWVTTLFSLRVCAMVLLVAQIVARMRMQCRKKEDIRHWRNARGGYRLRHDGSPWQKIALALELASVQPNRADGSTCVFAVEMNCDIWRCSPWAIYWHAGHSHTSSWHTSNRITHILCRSHTATLLPPSPHQSNYTHRLI